MKRLKNYFDLLAESFVYTVVIFGALAFVYGVCSLILAIITFVFGTYPLALGITFTLLWMLVQLILHARITHDKRSFKTGTM